MVPEAFGYGADLKQASLHKYTYPNGPLWFSSGFSAFKGCMAPPFTPFSPDGKNLQNETTPAYARVLKQQGCTGVWVNGSSGEFASMTVSERMRVLDSWAATEEVRNGEISIINHIGCNSLEYSIELAKHSERQGVYAIALAAPSYYKPNSEREIANWIHAVAKEVPSTPVFYYHIPKFNSVQSQVHVALEMARDLSPNVVGVKFTDARFDDLALCVKGGFNVLVGADTMFGSALAAGADGMVGIGVNFMGRSFRNIYDLMEQGKWREANEEQEKSRQVFKFMNEHGFLQVAKWLMEPVWGMDMGPVRLPHSQLS